METATSWKRVEAGAAEVGEVVGAAEVGEVVGAAEVAAPSLSSNRVVLYFWSPLYDCSDKFTQVSLGGYQIFSPFLPSLIPPYDPPAHDSDHVSPW